MEKLFENWRRLLKEGGPFGVGADVPTLAGTQGVARGNTIATHTANVEPVAGKDSSQVVKAVLERNGQVILLKNDKGWDLPGGHRKDGEDPVTALKREVYEETQMQITDVIEITDITVADENEESKTEGPGLKITIDNSADKTGEAEGGNKVFFGGKYLKDDVSLSGEHFKYDFFSLQDINEMPDGGKHGLSKEYKQAINAYFEQVQDMPL